MSPFLRHLPNLLTTFRILCIPVLVLLYYVPGLELHQRDLYGMLVFVLAAITDYFDGFTARKLKQISNFGSFFDPVADKLMVSTALVLLTYMQRVDALVALIIIGREITISAMREWMARIGRSQAIAVNYLGKIKTISQLLAIPFLLYYEPLLGFNVPLIGQVLIYIAAALTLWSMTSYVLLAWKQIKDEKI